MDPISCITDFMNQLNAEQQVLFATLFQLIQDTNYDLFQKLPSNITSLFEFDSILGVCHDEGNSFEFLTAIFQLMNFDTIGDLNDDAKLALIHFIESRSADLTESDDSPPAWQLAVDEVLELVNHYGSNTVSSCVNELSKILKEPYRYNQWLVCLMGHNGEVENCLALFKTMSLDDWKSYVTNLLHILDAVMKTP